MNSDALALKNGTFASPAVARASSVLPVPGAPDSSTPFGARAPTRRYFPGSRRKSTTSLISASTSSIPATSSKVTRTALGIDRLARAAATEQPPAHRRPLAPEHPDVEGDQQQDRRIEISRLASDAPVLDQRRRAHGGAARRQLGQQVVGREGRPLGRELLVGRVLLVGQRHRLLQLPLDRVAAREHLLDVLPRDLRLELGVGDRLRAAHPVLHGEQAEQDQVADEERGHPGPAPARKLRRLPLRQPLGAPRLGGRLLGLAARLRTGSLLLGFRLGLRLRLGHEDPLGGVPTGGPGRPARHRRMASVCFG